jgi:RHS repeat-associated protein
VTAVNAVGNRGAGAVSAIVSYNPGSGPCTPPVPAGFAATPTLSTTGSFQLSWQAGCNTATYSLEERVNGGAFGFFSSVLAPNLSLSVSGKPTGTYEYRILACSASSKAQPILCSALSVPVSVQVAIPGGIVAPTNFGLTAGSQLYTNGNYSFQWSAVSTATSYKVCEYDTAGGAATLCKTVTGLSSISQPFNHAINEQLFTFYYDVKACAAGTCSAGSTPQYPVQIDCPPGTLPGDCLPARPTSTNSTKEAGVVTYVHTDQLGSPVAETNALGALTTRFRYEAFGQSLESNPVQGPGYTGHVVDAASGLIYMQQRYYDPVIGRFLSTDPDPVNAVGTNFNRYAYVGNNPYRYVDPDGRQITGTANVGPALQEACGGSLGCQSEVAGKMAVAQATILAGEGAGMVISAAAGRIGAVLVARAAAQSATRVASVVEKSGKSIQAAVANSNKAVKVSGRAMEVLPGANGAKVAIGTVNGVVNGPPGTAAAVLIGSDGAATVGTATVSMVGKGVDVVKSVVEFVANKVK